MLSHMQCASIMMSLLIGCHLEYYLPAVQPPSLHHFGLASESAATRQGWQAAQGPQHKSVSLLSEQALELFLSSRVALLRARLAAGADATRNSSGSSLAALLRGLAAPVQDTICQASQAQKTYIQYCAVQQRWWTDGVMYLASRACKHSVHFASPSAEPGESVPAAGGRAAAAARSRSWRGCSAAAAAGDAAGARCCRLRGRAAVRSAGGWEQQHARSRQMAGDPAVQHRPHGETPKDTDVLCSDSTQPAELLLVR